MHKKNHNKIAEISEQLASGETDIPDASDSNGLAFTTQS